jgi:hypothetical protein
LKRQAGTWCCFPDEENQEGNNRETALASTPSASSPARQATTMDRAYQLLVQWETTPSKTKCRPNSGEKDEQASCSVCTVSTPNQNQHKPLNTN